MLLSSPFRCSLDPPMRKPQWMASEHWNSCYSQCQSEFPMSSGHNTPGHGVSDATTGGEWTIFFFDVLKSKLTLTFQEGISPYPLHISISWSFGSRRYQAGRCWCCMGTTMRLQTMRERVGGSKVRQGLHGEFHQVPVESEIYETAQCKEERSGRSLTLMESVIPQGNTGSSCADHSPGRPEGRPGSARSFGHTKCSKQWGNP